MKKFITTISLQVTNLEKVRYIAADNYHLTYDVPNSFPILSDIKNSVNSGDEIEIVPILIKNILHADVTNKNFETFKEQLEELANAENFRFTIAEPIIKNEDDKYETLIHLFSELLKHVCDNDELHACVSSGTKPVSIITLMTLNYAYKVRKNVSVKRIVYGGIRWNDAHTDKTGEIYDITPLFYIDSSIESLSKMKLESPEAVLMAMLGLEHYNE